MSTNSHLSQTAARGRLIRHSIIWSAVAAALAVSAGTACASSWDSHPITTVGTSDALQAWINEGTDRVFKASDAKGAPTEPAVDSDGYCAENLVIFGSDVTANNFSTRFEVAGENNLQVLGTALVVSNNMQTASTTFTGDTTEISLVLTGDSMVNPEHESRAVQVANHNYNAATPDDLNINTLTFAADKTVINAESKGVKGASFMAVSVKDSSRLEFTGKEVEINARMENNTPASVVWGDSDDYPSVYHASALEVSGFNFNNRINTGVYTSADTLLTINMVGTGDKTSNFVYDTNGAPTILGLGAEGGSFQMDGTTNINVSAVGGSAVGAYLEVQAMDYDSFSEIRDGEWKWTKLGEQVNHDVKAVFNKPLTMNVKSETGAAVGVMLMGACCNMDGDSNLPDNRTYYEVNEEGQRYSTAGAYFTTNSDFNLTVEKGKDNQNATVGVKFVETPIGGNPELFLNGKTVITADKALVSEYWPVDDGVNDPTHRPANAVHVFTSENSDITLNGTVDEFYGNVIMHGGSLTLNTPNNKFFGGGLRVFEGTFKTTADYDSTGFSDDPTKAPVLKVFNNGSVTIGNMTIGDLSPQVRAKMHGGSLTVNGNLKIEENAKLGANGGVLTVNNGTSYILGRVGTVQLDEAKNEEDRKAPDSTWARLHVNGGSLSLGEKSKTHLSRIWLTDGATVSVAEGAKLNIERDYAIFDGTFDAPHTDFISNKNGRFRLADEKAVANLRSLTLKAPLEGDESAPSKVFAGQLNVNTLNIDLDAWLGTNGGTINLNGGDSVIDGRVGLTLINVIDKDTGIWTNTQVRPEKSETVLNVNGGSLTLNRPTAENTVQQNNGVIRVANLNVSDNAVFNNNGDVILEDTMTVTDSAVHNKGTVHGQTLVLNKGADWYDYEPTAEQKKNGIHVESHFGTMIFGEGSRFISQETEAPDYIYAEHGSVIFRGGQIYNMAADGTASDLPKYLVIGGDKFEADDDDTEFPHKGYPDYPQVAFEAGDYAFDNVYVGVDEDNKAATGTLTLNGSNLNLANGLTVTGFGTAEIAKGTLTAGGISVGGGNLNVTGGTVNTSSFFVGKEGTTTITGGLFNAGKLELEGSVLLNGGTLATTTDQIFTTKLNDNGDNADVGGLTTSGSHLTLNGGTLQFNDAKYNLAYAGNAAKAFGTSYDKKTLWFTGDLVEANNGKIDAGDLPDTGETDNIYANITVDISKGEADENGKVTASIDKNFGAKDLNIGSGVTNVDVKKDTKLTIVGSSDNGNLINSVEKDTNLSINGSLELGQVGASDKGGKIDVNLDLKKDGSLTINDGKFDIKNVISADGNITISKGDVTIGSIEAKDGNLTIDNGKVKIDLIKADGGKISVSDGDVTIDEINLSDKKTDFDLGKNQLTEIGKLVVDKTKDVIHTITGALHVDDLVAGEGDKEAVIQVGSNDTNGSANKRGELKIGGKTLGGLKFFLDPAWVDGEAADVADASSLIYNHTDVDGQIVVGQNSYAVIGTDSADDFKQALNNSRLTWGSSGVTAAAYVAAPTTVTNGALVVDGSYTSVADAGSITNGSVVFGANSLLVADMTSLNDDASLAMITADSFDVDSTAKAVLTNVKSGVNYTLTALTDGTAADGFTADNILAANGMFKIGVNDDGTISATITDAALVYGSAMQGTALANAGMAADSTSAAYAYADKLLSNPDQTLANDTVAARFDAAMNPAGALTTFTTAYDRASELRQIVREETMKETGDRVWAHVTGGKTELKGISTGGLDLHTKTNAYGITLGTEADVGDSTIGAALMAGTGDTKNSSVSAKDDFNFYGVSLYGKTTAGNIDLLADASATFVKSDLTVGGAANVDTDVTTSVYSFGVQGQTTFNLDAVDVTPFIGANFYHVRGGSYDNGHGADVQSSNATAVEFPIGAKVSKVIETTGGMTVAPAFSLAVVPTVGDRDIDSKVKFADAQSTYNYTFTDDVKVRANLGIDATSNNFSLGIQAGYEWGNEERSSASVQVRAKYMF